MPTCPWWSVEQYPPPRLSCSGEEVWVLEGKDDGFTEHLLGFSQPCYIVEGQRALLHYGVQHGCLTACRWEGQEGWGRGEEEGVARVML